MTITWKDAQVSRMKAQNFWTVCHRVFTPEEYLLHKVEQSQAAPIASFDQTRTFILDGRNEKAPKPAVRCKLDAVCINWDNFRVTVDWVVMNR